ncbi:MAG: hypothetical protein M3083_03730 [Actinomycetota bacterium]|nr:hypothetical protein [Actinomycetota bacterium]MDQ6945689.1 hypothetical protein [Actinomycetota bacterium]
MVVVLMVVAVVVVVGTVVVVTTTVVVVVVIAVVVVLSVRGGTWTLFTVIPISALALPFEVGVGVSFTWTPTTKLPDDVGTPVIRPKLDMVSPGGASPEKVYGGLPPVAWTAAA